VGAAGALALAVVLGFVAVVQIGTVQVTGAASRQSGGRYGPSRPTKATVPGAPSGVTALAGSSNATVTWATPASNGGSVITGYVVIPSTGSRVYVGAVTSVVVTGLTNGTAYRFTVAAVNDVGTGPASAASNVVTPEPAQTSTPPTTPTNPTTPTTPTTPATSALLVPLYDSSAADWSETCAALAGTNSLVVADIGNPGGPGTSASAAWATNIGYCGAAHVGAMGYVDTGYCQVPLATAEGQVDSWYAWYGADGISGIFFDEADDPSNPNATSDCLSHTSSAVSYYRTLAAFVHALAAGQTVTFNFGENPASNWALSSTVAGQNADIAVVFEDTYSDFLDYGSGAPWSPAAWESAYGAQHFSVLVYDTIGADQPAAACAALAGQNVGYGYFTPNSGWTSPPPAQFLDGEVADC
jgi:uncharacterized membrane protein